MHSHDNLTEAHFKEPKLYFFTRPLHRRPHIGQSSYKRFAKHRNQQVSASAKESETRATPKQERGNGSSKNGHVEQDTSEEKEGDEEDPEKALKEKQIQSEQKKAKEKNFDPKAFHLPTAIALGCCSFEAYNAPYRSYGVKEVSPCSSETIFIDHDFLAARIQGILEIHLRRAVGLQGPDVNSEDESKKKASILPTSRCRICVHPSAGFSDVIKKSADPAWRQTFFLYVQDKISQKLDILVESVNEKDDTENQELGTATLENLDEICDGDIHNMSVKLHRDLDGKKEECGEVHLSARFQSQDAEHDLLRSIKGQAVGQMINDDWCYGASQEWENADADSDWRYTGLPDSENFAILSDKDPIDIEGGELAEGQPLERQPWKDWTELRELVIKEQDFPDLQPIAFVMNKKSDTELWIYANWVEKKIAISFRGTSSPKDMLTDMSLDLAAFNPEGDEKNKDPEEVAQEIPEEEWEKGPFGGMYKALKTVEKLPVTHALNKILIKTAKGKKKNSVTKGLSGWAKAQMMMLYALEHDHKWCHNGFLQAYTSVSQVVVRLVDEIMNQRDKIIDKEEHKGKQNWQIFLTGHSMGGAHASLCSFELAKRDYGKHEQPKITMYTFGQPRVGNQPFAEAYDEAVPDSWRIKNAEDIVTTVPGLLGYRHIGNEVKLSQEGDVVISCISTDNVREGEFLADLIPKLKDGMTGENKEMQSELKQLMKGEIDMMKAIMKGDGVSQHMEDMYHNYLHGCSKKGDDWAAPVKEAMEEAQQRISHGKLPN